MVQMNSGILLLLLTATQVPLLVYALVVQKANKELQASLTRLTASSLGLPLPPMPADRAAAPPEPRVMREVRHIRFPVPTGAVPRQEGPK